MGKRLRVGYFQLPPREREGATLILIPQFSGGVSALELTLWAQKSGFGDLAYIPARAIDAPAEDLFGVD